MKTRGLFLTSLLVAGAMVAFAFYTANLLPEGARLPVHWGGAGDADRMAAALPALLMPAGILLLVSGLLGIIPKLEPLQDRLEGSEPLLRTVWIGILALFPVIQFYTAAPAFGIDLPGSVRTISVGLLLTLFGNALPKSRPGFFVGIRTPWTITDTDNWIATHRLGGKLMLLGGLFIVIESLLPLDPKLHVALFFAAVLAIVVPPIVFSWWYWHRKKRSAANG